MNKYLFIIILIGLTIFSCKNENKSQKNNDASRSKIINASEINRKIANGENIAYKNVTIIGDIDFSKAKDSYLEALETRRHYINTGILFYNCTFKGKIIANSNDKKEIHLVTFNKNLTFLKCTFQDKIKFNNVDFKGIVNVQGSIFQDEFTIVGSSFNFIKNYFMKNKFQKLVKFIGNRINGDISFFESKFSERAILQNNIFMGVAQFSSTVFDKNVDFSGINANLLISFGYAEFNDKVLFNNAIFGSRADFIETKFTNAEFINAKFYGKTRYNKSIIKRVISFEKSFFFLEKLDTSEIKIDKKTNIILKNTVYLHGNSFSDF